MYVFTPSKKWEGSGLLCAGLFGVWTHKLVEGPADMFPLHLPKPLDWPSTTGKALQGSADRSTGWSCSTFLQGTHRGFKTSIHSI